MKCIFYEKKSGGLAAKLLEMLKALAGENTTEMYHTIKKLSQRLTKPVDDRAVMIIIPSDRGDLLDILSLQKLLCDIRVIIILPDREDESVRIGYKLKPRFLTYVNGDLVEVHAVLSKMLELSERPERIAGQ